MKRGVGMGSVVKGFRKLVTLKVIVVPLAHSGLVVQALESVTELTYEESEGRDLLVQGVVEVPIRQDTEEDPSKNTFPVGNVTRTAPP